MILYVLGSLTLIYLVWCPIVDNWAYGKPVDDNDFLAELVAGNLEKLGDNTNSLWLNQDTMRQKLLISTTFSYTTVYMVSSVHERTVVMRRIKRWSKCHKYIKRVRRALK